MVCGASRLLGHTAATHERHVVGSGKLAVQRSEFHWVNTLLGNLKTALSGTYHAINHARYAHRYLAKFTYRFNRRFDLVNMGYLACYVPLLPQNHILSIY